MAKAKKKKIVKKRKFGSGKRTPISYNMPRSSDYSSANTPTTPT